MNIENKIGKILDKYYKPKSQAEEEDFVCCGNELMEVLEEEIEKALNEIVPKEKFWLWLACNDETGEERILSRKQYEELDKKEGWRWSGHTIQAGWNSCRDEIKQNINNYLNGSN